MNLFLTNLYNMNIKVFDLLCVLLLVSFLNKLYFEKELYTKVNKLVLHKFWLISFIIILAWSYYVFVLKNKFEIYKKENQDAAALATKHALFGFLITICGYLDMTIWVFWLTWIMSFYLEGWV
jgi:hypothetical protein